MTRKPTIAVVGAGRIGRVHIGNLLALGAAVVVVEPDPGAAEAIAQLMECAVVPHPDALPSVDGAMICVPTSAHEPVARELFKHKCPLLVEKPCTGDPATSAALGTDADACGVPLLVGFQRRFSPELRWLRNAYRARTAPVRWGLFVSFDGTFPPEGYEPAGNSLALDLQIHDVDTVLWLFGQEVNHVSAVEVEEPATGRSEQLVTTLVLADGIVCSVVCRRTNPRGCHVFAQLCGERELLDTREVHPERSHADFRSRFAVAYLEEARQFLHHVMDGRSELASWRDAVAAEDVCRWIERSRSRHALELRNA